jgi:hypothetical protein
LIEQYQYTTTQKYNFPQPTPESWFPQHLLQLSLSTLRNIGKRRLFHLYTTVSLENSTQKQEETTQIFDDNRFKPKPIPLKPVKDETPIIAVDVSSIKIGETDFGILCAIRAAIVWKRKHQYRYLRLGPFPFHITEENIKEVYRLFRHYSLLEESAQHLTTGSTDLIHAPTRLGTLLERWLQMTFTAQTRNGIILWDGSLTAGIQDAPVAVMKRLLETARNNSNTVLAFTKITRLRLLGRCLTDYVQRCKPPCLLEMDGYPMSLSPTIRLLGKIFVAKLGAGSCAFRLDIDRKLSEEKALEAVQRLLGNDIIVQSYPETLRLAHIHSTFTANEVIGIQRFLARTHQLKIVTKPDVRRLLFGPFGKGSES